MAALNGRLLLDGAAAIEELEVELLLEAVFQRFGYDFRGYDRPRLRQRLHRLMAARSLATISALQEKVLHEAQAGAALLRALAVAPAVLFDDPEQACQLRIVLASSLRSSAVPKVWLAECAGAQEAWSLAILLAEEGLLARSEIHATMASDELLADAATASFDVDRLDEYQENYYKGGGTARLTDYIDIKGRSATLKPALRQRITWSQYNLVTDASFNEFQLILCRRALPDFGPALRKRVLRLFNDSLALFGVLGLDRPLSDDDEVMINYQSVFDQRGWYKRIR